MKKITTIAILLLFVLHSNAQIVPVEKKYDYKIAGKGIPAGTYLKDVNHLFDAYVGIWKGSIDLKTYTFFITKRTETNYGVSIDALFIHYLITDLQGIAIEDSRAPGGSGEIWGRFFQPNLLSYLLQYAAENSFCGRIGQVAIRKINATTMTLYLSPQPEGHSYDQCPGGIMQEQILPTTTSVTLKKQPDNASIMTTIVLKNWYRDDDNDGHYSMTAKQAEKPLVGVWKEGVSLYSIKDCDDNNPNRAVDCPAAPVVVNFVTKINVDTDPIPVVGRVSFDTVYIYDAASTSNKKPSELDASGAVVQKAFHQFVAALVKELGGSGKGITITTEDFDATSADLVVATNGKIIIFNSNGGYSTSLDNINTLKAILKAEIDKM